MKVLKQINLLIAFIGVTCVNSFAQTVKWSVNTGANIICSPVVGDIKPATAGSEIIFGDINGKVYCFPASGVSPLWTYNTGLGHIMSPAIADIDNDGVAEVFFHCEDGGAGYLYCLNNSGGLKWRFQTNDSCRVYSLPVVDIDYDGIPEILTLGRDISGYCGLYCINAVTGSEIWHYTNSAIGPTRSGFPTVANLDEVGAPEILFGGGNVLYCLDNTGTLLNQFNFTPELDIITGISIADVDLDGDAEILASVLKLSPTHKNQLYCFKWTLLGGFSQKWLWEKDVGASLLLREPSPSMVAIDNLDGDGKPEIVIFSNDEASVNPQDKIFVLLDNSTSASEVWSAIAEYSGITVAWWGGSPSPVIFDIDGDGDKDIVWEGSNYLRIYDGLSGSVLYENTTFKVGSYYPEHPAVADIDNDKHAEIIAVYNQTGIGVLENDASWVPARDQFSSYAYHITNIHNDLSIPQIEPNSWEVHNSWLSQGSYIMDTTAIAGWFPQYNSVSPVRAISGSWAVGDKGLILKRDNSSQWTPVTVTALYLQNLWYFYGVCEVLPDLVFIVGTKLGDLTAPPCPIPIPSLGVILKGERVSGNWGWTAIYSVDIVAANSSVLKHDLAFFSVDFADPYEGLVGCSRGYVLKTGTGGGSASAWRPSDPNMKIVPAVQDRHFECVTSIKINNSSILASTDNSGIIAATFNGGTTWPAMPSYPNPASSPDGHGWAVPSFISKEDIKHANFGITVGWFITPFICLSNEYIGSIPTGSKQSFHTPNTWATWIMNGWYGDIGGSKVGKFYVGTSDVIYKTDIDIGTAQEYTNQEYTKKYDDLYGVYSQGNTGWMAWAGGRHLNFGTVKEEGTILGRYYTPIKVEAMAIGDYQKVKIRFYTRAESNILHYEVYRDISEVGAFTSQVGGNINPNPSKSYSIDDAGISYNMPYWYKIKIVSNDPTYSVYHWIGPFKTDPNPWGLATPVLPGNPINLVQSPALQQHGEKIPLWWPNSPPNVDFYYIGRSEKSGGPYEYVGKTVSNEVYFSDYTGAPEQRYYYVVQGVKNNIPSLFSNETAGHAYDNISPPQVTANTIGVAWNTFPPLTAHIYWRDMPFTDPDPYKCEPNLGGYWVRKIISNQSGTNIVFDALLTLSPIQRTWYLDKYTQSERDELLASYLNVYYQICAMDRSGNFNEWSEWKKLSMFKKCSFVSPNGNDNNPGTEAEPWLTLQKAATTMKPGEAVYVKGGTYSETITPQNSGDPDSGSIYYIAYPDDVAIISGDNTRNYGFNISGKSHIYISGFEIKDCKERGIFVENSPNCEMLNNNIHNNGKIGIYCLNSDSVRIENNVCNDNLWGIYFYGTDFSTVENNIAHSNDSIGIYLSTGADTNTVYGNECDSNIVGICLGASQYNYIRRNNCQGNSLRGMYISYSAHSNRVDSNKVWNNYNGILCYNNSSNLFNRNVVFNNSNVGIYLYSSVISCRVYNNTVHSNKYGIYLYNSSYDNHIVNNIIDSSELYGIYSNSSSATNWYNDVWANNPNLGGSIDTGIGNISANPLFVDIANADFRLRANSPCINAGYPAWDTLVPDTGIDIGAYEFSGEGYGWFGGPSGQNVNNPQFTFKLYQNYPNPFTSHTTIQYSVARKSDVSLKIYDVSGREVKTLANESQNAGLYTVKLDTKNFPSGIYFAKFRAGDYKETKKLILVR